MKPDVRKGQFPGAISREAFRERFRARFYDPAFRAEDEALDRLEAIAWDGYCQARKAPITRKAGAEFQDPDHDLSVEWYEARNRIRAAQQRWEDAASPARAGRQLRHAQRRHLPRRDVQELPPRAHRAGGAAGGAGGGGSAGLSWLASDYDRRIHPCKGCVSTAMPLCHWPCSCYPNHELGQVNDWMNEIFERWTAAHGVLLVTPTHWYTVSSPLKLMMDRMVCADGGNPDPTRTGGKDPEKAKQLELEGWDYPQHLAGRAYAVVVRGDVAGIEDTRRVLSDWLDWMGLIDAGPQARLDRYIGYYEPYATSHAALDRDDAVQEEVRNAARALLEAVGELRRGLLSAPGRGLKKPRPK